jgi:ketosteroid isomerase-like protein
MKKANVKFEVTNVTLAEDGNSAVVEAVVLGSIDLEKGGVKDSVDTKTNLVKIQDKWLVEFKLK